MRSHRDGSPAQAPSSREGHTGERCRAVRADGQIIPSGPRLAKPKRKNGSRPDGGAGFWVTATVPIVQTAHLREVEVGGELAHVPGKLARQELVRVRDDGVQESRPEPDPPAATPANPIGKKSDRAAAYDPFRPTVADLLLPGEPEAEFDDAFVEKWVARLDPLGRGHPVVALESGADLRVRDLSGLALARGETGVELPVGPKREKAPGNVRPLGTIAADAGLSKGCSDSELPPNGARGRADRPWNEGTAGVLREQACRRRLGPVGVPVEPGEAARLT